MNHNITENMTISEEFLAYARNIAMRDQSIRENQTETALEIYAMISTGLYHQNGFQTLNDMVSWMRVEWKIQLTVRQIRRYRHAVATWIRRLGYDKSVMVKWGPSILGQLSEMGVVPTRKMAEFWFARLEKDGPAVVRREAERHLGWNMNHHSHIPDTNNGGHNGRQDATTFEQDLPQDAELIQLPTTDALDEELHELEKVVARMEAWAAGEPVTPRMVAIQVRRLRHVLDTLSGDPSNQEATA